MLIKKMTKIIKIIFSISFIFIFNSHASENNFETWLSNFKKIAISEGISEGVVNNIMGNAKFLPVIEYDRFQPNFTKTHLHTLKKGHRKKSQRRDKALQERKINN